MSKLSNYVRRSSLSIPRAVYKYISLYKLNRFPKERLFHAIKNIHPKIKNCNICGWAGKMFFQDARCPMCFSLPRHRFLGYIINQIDLHKKKNVLLIGTDMPEILLFKKRGFNQVTILNKEKTIFTDVVCDITNNQLGNNAFDLIIMWHVLEHINEDRLAVENVYHLLRKDGKFIFSVPIYPPYNNNTYKPKFSSLNDRTKKTGHPDHVICCGKDYADRFSKLNFQTKKMIQVNNYSRSEIEQYHLSNNHYAWCFEK